MNMQTWIENLTASGAHINFTKVPRGYFECTITFSQGNPDNRIFDGEGENASIAFQKAMNHLMRKGYDWHKS